MTSGSVAAKAPKHVPLWVSVLAIAGLAAGASWFVWTKATEAPKPFERTAADFDVTWTCDRGHSFVDKGAPGSKPCPTCGGPAYASFGCACQNGACGYTAQMQLRYNDKCETEAMRWRPSGEWQPYIFPPKCPKCGGPMRPG